LLPNRVLPNRDNAPGLSPWEIKMKSRRSYKLQVTLEGILRLFEDTPPFILGIGNITFILFLGMVDYYTGIEFSFSIFYLLPISITSWYVGNRTGILASTISGIVWFLADIGAGHVYSSTLILVWNSLMRLGLFLIISMVLSTFRLNLNRLHQDELALQKSQTIIHTSQQITTMVSENIARQNAEIIKWIDNKKKKGHSVSAKVDRASRAIGSCLHVLSELSFVHPYTDDSSTDADAYLELLANRLDQVQKESSRDTEESDADSE
jgi:hypothetical protein